jgi:16S rRNA (cytosine1402-N4)-methyltransferase
MTFTHLPVLKKELIEGLSLREGFFCVDATFGGGGHAKEVLASIGSTGVLIGLDKDQYALDSAHKAFDNEIAHKNLFLFHSAFQYLSPLLDKQAPGRPFDAIYADIGVSSPQLDLAERGFSFQKEAPLDMRMDQSQTITAEQVLNTMSIHELKKIFIDYGEERYSAKIAAAIVKQRATTPFKTTTQLAHFVAHFYPKKNNKHHPATRIFQALRIYVNNELEELREFLPSAFSRLRKGGKLAVITFHSLEDRIVKQFFKSISSPSLDIPKSLPVTHQELAKLSQPQGRIIKPFPILPSLEEVSTNPRSRSAKLRIIEKI